MSALPFRAGLRPGALRRAGLLLVACLAVLPATAQEVRTISFDEAVQIALERNSAIEQARNDVALQETVVASERADFWPDLNFSTAATRNYGLSFDQTTGRLSSETNDRASFDIGTSVNLFNGFADAATLDEARAGLDVSRASLARARQRVLFDVVTNYLQVLLEQERVEIQGENVEAQRRQLERIEEFVELGARPVSDLYQQQATLASAELALLEAEQAVALGTTRLIQVLQLDPFGTYRFTAPATDELALEATPYELEALLRRAFAQRDDLRAQSSRIDAADAGIRAARAGYLPSLSLSGGIGTGYSSGAQVPVVGDGGEVIGLTNSPFAEQLGDNRSEFVSLRLSVPIFDRFRTRTSVRRARVQRQNAELALRTLEHDVALDVRQAYLDYRTAAKRLDVTAAQLRAAEQALEVEQERYDLGASTLVELTQARAAFVEASGNRAQAVYRFLFQEKLVEYHLGTLDPAQTLFE